MGVMTDFSDKMNKYLIFQPKIKNTILIIVYLKLINFIVRAGISTLEGEIAT